MEMKICSIEPAHIADKRIRTEYEKFIEFIQKEFTIRSDRVNFYTVYAEVEE